MIITWLLLFLKPKSEDELTAILSYAAGSLSY